jgi:hypothetical protein
MTTNLQMKEDLNYLRCMSENRHGMAKIEVGVCTLNIGASPLVKQ